MKGILAECLRRFGWNVMLESSKDCAREPEHEEEQAIHKSHRKHSVADLIGQEAHRIEV